MPVSPQSVSTTLGHQTFSGTLGPNYLKPGGPTVPEKIWWPNVVQIDWSESHLRPLEERWSSVQSNWLQICTGSCTGSRTGSIGPLTLLLLYGFKNRFACNSYLKVRFHYSNFAIKGFKPSKISTSTSVIQFPKWEWLSPTCLTVIGTPIPVGLARLNLSQTGWTSTCLREVETSSHQVLWIWITLRQFGLSSSQTFLASNLLYQVEATSCQVIWICITLRHFLLNSSQTV